MKTSELAIKLAEELDIHVAMGGGKFLKEVANVFRQFQLAESIIKQQELRIAELEAKIDEMAGEIMTLENRIGAMTGYGHN